MFSILLILCGCGKHYSRSDAAKWFRQQVLDEKIVVSKNHLDQENRDGYTDRIWMAYLADLPEVEFKLISTILFFPPLPWKQLTIWRWENII